MKGRIGIMSSRIHPRPGRLLLATALFGGAASVSAKEHIVSVTWSADGSYRAELPVPKGKLKEACVDLKQGERIRWSFRADADTSFNIHYHEGEKVTYPAKKENVAADEGVLDVAVTQGYCWMWRAPNHPAKVEVTLEKAVR
jgi:hypothetical protein